MLLSEGEVAFDTLVIHTQSSAWVSYSPENKEGVQEYNDALHNVIDELERKHILFHLGDETIMEKYARVEGCELVIGTQRYKRIILPPYKVLFDSTKKLLDEFSKAGGVITTACDIQENDIVDNPDVTYTMRRFDGFDLHYFVNTTKNYQCINIRKGTGILNIRTGETENFKSEYTLCPMDSVVVIDEEKKTADYSVAEKNLEILLLDGEWEVKSCDYNAVALDYCDYWFDGELIEENGYVLDIQQKACNLKRRVDLKMRFSLNVGDVPEVCYLVCETPEIFRIFVNEKEVDKKDCGYYLDKSFRKIDIAEYLVSGVNDITFLCDFVQSDEVYQNMEKAFKFEGYRNKLTYDMEIEGIFVVGDFDVRTNGVFEKLDKDAVRYSGDFEIVKKKSCVELRHMEANGYPFFAGEITFEKTVNLEHCDYKLAFNKKGINVIRISINDMYADTLIWNPFEADISGYLKKGENKITITLVNNLRNLLGPHHLAEGESYAVGPGSFYREPTVFNKDNRDIWDDNYCFVEFGIE